MQRGDRRRLLLQNRGDEARLRLALEGPPSGDHLVQHRAEREDVRAGVRLAPSICSGRHVLKRAQDRARRVRPASSVGIDAVPEPRRRRRRHLCQAEVEQLRAPTP